MTIPPIDLTHPNAPIIDIIVGDNSIDTIKETINDIIRLNYWLAKFWSNAYGWASNSSAELISKSRLDNQVSLSLTLKIWLENGTQEIQGENGRLILAWANLGALVEGTLKLYLSAYCEDYRIDFHAYRNKKNEKLQDPDTLTLEKLRVFFNKRELWSTECDEYVRNIQNKRNAIHSFQDKDIGNFKEFYQYLPRYLAMVKVFNLGLPYPDEVGIPFISEDLIPIVNKISAKLLKEKHYDFLDF
jgi:hypothetical protein